MTVDDWKALCAELLCFAEDAGSVAEHESMWPVCDADHTLLGRARTALAEPEPEEAVNPWKDALIDALVCAFILNEENESNPKKALHDLISWELELAKDPLINPPRQPVSVSDRLPEENDCDNGCCWFGNKLSFTNKWEWFYGEADIYMLSGCMYWLPASTKVLPTIYE